MTLTVPPRPLHPTLATAIATDIATRLRAGWRPAKAARAVHPTGNPRSHNLPTPGAHGNPNTYLEPIFNVPYQWGLIDPTHNTPPLVWHLTQTNMLEALQTDAALMVSAAKVDAWYRQGGALAYAPPGIRGVFLACTEAATVYQIELDAWADATDDEPNDMDLASVLRSLGNAGMSPGTA